MRNQRCLQNPAVQWYDPEGLRTSMVANHGRCVLCISPSARFPALNPHVVCCLDVSNSAAHTNCTVCEYSCASKRLREKFSDTSSLPRMALR